MKKVICFVLMLFIFSFSFVSAADTTQTDVEVTDEEAVELIQSDFNFENFTDIVSSDDIFFLHQSNDGKYHLMVINNFNSSWTYVRFLSSNLWSFISYSGESFYYIADSSDMTFERSNGWTYSFSSYLDLDSFMEHSLYNFDVLVDHYPNFNGVLFESNIDDYISTLPPNPPTTSFDVYASDGSMLFTDSMSATGNFISSFATPLFDKLNSFNAVTFIILISVFCVALIFTFKVITNG